MIRISNELASLATKILLDEKQLAAKKHKKLFHFSHDHPLHNKKEVNHEMDHSHD